jgi:hypothetical protein
MYAVFILRCICHLVVNPYIHVICLCLERSSQKYKEQVAELTN